MAKHTRPDGSKRNTKAVRVYDEPKKQDDDDRGDCFPHAALSSVNSITSMGTPPSLRITRALPTLSAQRER